MIKTFIALIIANIKIVYIILIVVCCGLVIVNKAPDDQLQPTIVQSTNTSGAEDGNIMFMSLTYLLLFVLPVIYKEDNTSTILSLFVYIAAIYLLINYSAADTSSVLVWGGCSLIVSWFVSIWTYLNIDEVISRRMRFRNSNVDLLDYTFMYSMNRGTHALIASFAIISIVSILSSL